MSIVRTTAAVTGGAALAFGASLLGATSAGAVPASAGRAPARPPVRRPR